MHCKDVEVIAPHFKKRLSGVTTSVKNLIPLQRELGLNIAVMGPGLPEDLPRFYWRDIFCLWKKPKHLPFRIWHARRNNELLFGIFLQKILRMPLRTIFTFATQKKPNFYKKWLLKQADYVIATSEKNSFYLDIPHEIVMHGVNLKKFYPLENKTDFLLPKVLRGKYLAGCFGRIRPSKGTDIFVDAMISLLPYHKDWSAIIIGRTTASHQKFLRALQEKVNYHNLAERIIFLEENINIAPWYQHLSLFVNPSFSEGFGLTTLEAMACATAVVVSDVGAFSSMVTEKTGIIVEKTDQKNFTKAIELFFSDPQKTKLIGKEAFFVASQNFSLEKEAKALYKIYNRLWKNAPNPASIEPE